VKKVCNAQIRGQRYMNDIPRLTLEELEPELAAALKPRVARLGYLGEFFTCLGHQPTPLLAFVDFTESAQAALDKRSVEIIALTVSTRKNNDYERNQHERLSMRLGLGREWISQVEALRPDNAHLLSDSEKELQRFVLAATEERRAESQALFGTLVAARGNAAAVAILMVIGRYTAHALMVMALGIAPPVPSIYEDGFGVKQPPTS
jgi:alkylhydroperoxidase family enzyme